MLSKEEIESIFDEMELLTEHQRSPFLEFQSSSEEEKRPNSYTFIYAFSDTSAFQEDKEHGELE
jgi:hypothetical protein